MHPRTGAGAWSPATRQARRAAARLRPRARRRASARGRRALRSRHGDELLGRLLERDHAPARRHALSRPAARRPARGAASASTRRTHAPGRGRSAAARQRAARRAGRRRRRKYAPLPAASLSLPGQPACATPRRTGTARAARGARRARSAARARARRRHRLVLAGRRAAGSSRAPDAVVRLLAPFDPVVWDRRRFELFWGWAYRFEAYTPAAKRKLGYYALPLLWRDRVIGWANLAVVNGGLHAELGYVGSRAARPATSPRARRRARAHARLPASRYCRVPAARWAKLEGCHLPNPSSARCARN